MLNLDLTNIPTKELYSLKTNINLEINKRSKITFSKADFDIKEFVEFVEKNLELNLRDGSRKRNIVWHRMALYLYLRTDKSFIKKSKTGKDIHKFTHKKIGEIFHKDHSSIIHGLRNAVNYLQVGDSYFSDVFIETVKVITQYNQLQIIKK